MLLNILNLILLQSSGLPQEAQQAAAEHAGKISQEVAELKSLSLEDLINRLAQSAVSFAINLALAILVFYIGRFIIRKIYRLVQTIFIRREVDPSLSTFILSLINIVLYFILIVTVIGILGIETTSFLALFASAGVAIGMALSGTLQNFAGGVLILLLKPYKIGDYIEVQGFAGTVKEIQIFFTVITTYDNKSISIPNGGLSTGSVNNWTREEFRRVEWTVSISYGDDVATARRALLDLLCNDPRILDSNAACPTPMPASASHSKAEAETSVNLTSSSDISDNAPSPAKKRSLWNRLVKRHKMAQEAIAARDEKLEAELANILPKPDYTPKVLVKALASSSVDLTIRVWTKTTDYWAVYYAYNEIFYTELPKHGINFPFPQLDVHINKAN